MFERGLRSIESLGGSQSTTEITKALDHSSSADSSLSFEGLVNRQAVPASLAASTEDQAIIKPRLSFSALRTFDNLAALRTYQQGGHSPMASVLPGPASTQVPTVLAPRDGEARALAASSRHPQAEKPHYQVTIRDYLKQAGIVQGPPMAAKVDHVKSNEKAGKHPVTPEIREAVARASKKYNVPERMVMAIIHSESNFNPHAVSRVGARGLMQLMPGTAHDLGVNDVFDIEQNVDGGVRYYRQMLDRFGNDPKMALAAYNAGPGAVSRYGGVPPYRETRHYVSRVMELYDENPTA